MSLQCDHPSRGPHIASSTQHSPSVFSPDLTPCDFFLRCYLKSKIYLGGVPTLATLKDNILRTELSIPGDFPPSRMLCIECNVWFTRRVVTLKEARCYGAL
ncbi:hypothetical protein AVEN_191707-1 [Araneus ventricosus]|uniref:Uncharacterized protein n=1 Tax=Araneus ventricosus TaxID=182803 RepID=A0A4Y2LVL6_ARAVE|nr:hypothetical protein AVEN_191707-1 [Araneus ventricosus]